MTSPAYGCHRNNQGGGGGGEDSQTHAHCHDSNFTVLFKTF